MAIKVILISKNIVCDKCGGEKVVCEALHPVMVEQQPSSYDSNSMEANKFRSLLLKLLEDTIRKDDCGFFLFNDGRDCQGRFRNQDEWCCEQCGKILPVDVLNQLACGDHEGMKVEQYSFDGSNIRSQVIAE